VRHNLSSRASHRYAFIEFRNADAAIYALNEMNGHPFDTKHTFLINRFTDIEKFAELDETYVDPQREEYHSKVRPQFHVVTLATYGYTTGAFTCLVG